MDPVGDLQQARGGQAEGIAAQKIDAVVAVDDLPQQLDLVFDILHIKAIVGVAGKVAEGAFAPAAAVGDLQQGTFVFQGRTVDFGIVVQQLHDLFAVHRQASFQGKIGQILSLFYHTGKFTNGQ